MSNDVAPEGAIFFCTACGKTSPNRYGFDSVSNKNVAMAGWDESCMMHAVCFRKEDLTMNPSGRVLVMKKDAKEIVFP